MGIKNLCHKELVLHVANQPVDVGGGTDGASVNIAQQNGMKGKFQRELSSHTQQMLQICHRAIKEQICI